MDNQPLQGPLFKGGSKDAQEKSPPAPLPCSCPELQTPRLLLADSRETPGRLRTSARLRPEAGSPSSSRPGPVAPPLRGPRTLTFTPHGFLSHQEGPTSIIYRPSPPRLQVEVRGI